MTKDEINRLTKTERAIKATLVMYSENYGYFKDLNDNYFFARIDHNFYPIQRWENTRDVVESVFTVYCSSSIVDYDRLDE